MNAPFAAALDRALQGDAQALAGFGLEQQTLTAPLWDDRISVDGAGSITVTSKRAPGDKGGASIGTFAGKLGKAEFTALLTALRALALHPPPSSRSEAYETRVVLSAVCGGHTFGLGVAAHPDQLAPLQPVLLPLGAAHGQALKGPVRTLQAVLALPAGVQSGAPVPVQLHLVNAGPEGYWVQNPHLLENKHDKDRVGLSYAAPIAFEQGKAPTPVTPRRALLSTPKSAAPLEGRPRYLWVPGKGEAVLALEALLEPVLGAELVLRAELFVEGGPERVAGQPVLRGAVFSADLRARLS
jgi:hypothetical protein